MPRRSHASVAYRMRRWEDSAELLNNVPRSNPVIDTRNDDLSRLVNYWLGSFFSKRDDEKRHYTLFGHTEIQGPRSAPPKCRGHASNAGLEWQARSCYRDAWRCSLQRMVSPWRHWSLQMSAARIRRRKGGRALPRPTWNPSNSTMRVLRDRQSRCL